MDLERESREERGIGGSRSAGLCLAGFLILLALLPLILPGYSIYILNFLATQVLIAVGLNILVGYTGQISIGHAGFVAVGAYTGGYLLQQNWPFILALPAAGVVAGAAGLLLGFPALRLEGPYLAIATLGFGLAVVQIVGRLPELGGRMGLQIPHPSLGPLRFDSDQKLFYLIVSLTVFLVWLARNLMQSRIGRAFQAIRDSEIAAQSMGINVPLYKTLSFAISALLAGIAGLLLAITTGFINPDQFNFLLSIFYLAMVIAGGRGTILGSILGGILVGLITLQMDVLAELPILGEVLLLFSVNFMTRAGLPNVGLIFIGATLIAVNLFEPKGLYGIWIRTRRYWSTRAL